MEHLLARQPVGVDDEVVSTNTWVPVLPLDTDPAFPQFLHQTREIAGYLRALYNQIGKRQPPGITRSDILVALRLNLTALFNYWNTGDGRLLPSLVLSLSRALKMEPALLLPALQAPLYDQSARVTKHAITSYLQTASGARFSANPAPEAYVGTLLDAERKMRAPSFAYHPHAFPETMLDRNGWTLRVIPGHRLAPWEKIFLATYRMAQYASLNQDASRTPFFDWNTITLNAMRHEHIDHVFSGSDREFHVVMTDDTGYVVGYVAIEAPVGTGNMSQTHITFADARSANELYPLERMFGPGFLLQQFPELASVQVRSTIEIARLAPRQNTAARDRANTLVAIELVLTMIRLLDVLHSQGRSIAIMDTEMQKLAPIFRLLGISPRHVEGRPDVGGLPSPYDALLAPRYRRNGTVPGSDGKIVNRLVSVVAFNIGVFDHPRIRRRLADLEAILAAFAEERHRIGPQAARKAMRRLAGLSQETQVIAIGIAPL